MKKRILMSMMALFCLLTVSAQGKYPNGAWQSGPDSKYTGEASILAIIMMIFGVIGYLARKFDLNPAAIVLGLILGPIGERGLRRALMLSDGDPAVLFSTPLCWMLIALCVLGVLSPLMMSRLERRMKQEQQAAPASAENKPEEPAK